MYWVTGAVTERMIKMTSEIISKLKQQAGADNVKKAIVGIIEKMLEAAPEIEQSIADNEKGLEAVYSKLQILRSGSDKEILSVITEVYKMPVEFAIEIKIVRKENRQKIVDLFDFI